jgi:hypothetical protein
MQNLPKPITDLSRLPTTFEEKTSAPPDSLRQLAEWRAQAMAKRSFAPPPSVRRRNR